MLIGALFFCACNKFYYYSFLISLLLPIYLIRALGQNLVFGKLSLIQQQQQIVLACIDFVLHADKVSYFISEIVCCFKVWLWAGENIRHLIQYMADFI